MTRYHVILLFLGCGGDFGEKRDGLSHVPNERAQEQSERVFELSPFQKKQCSLFEEDQAVFCFLFLEFFLEKNHENSPDGPWDCGPARGGSLG